MAEVIPLTDISEAEPMAAFASSVPDEELVLQAIVTLDDEPTEPSQQVTSQQPVPLTNHDIAAALISRAIPDFMTDDRKRAIAIRVAAHRAGTVVTTKREGSTWQPVGLRK